MHFDVVATDRNAEVKRLVALGASVQLELDTWTVVQDPKSNEFCVTSPR